MANTLEVVSATNQYTEYGYSSFEILTEKSPGSKYYYKPERVELPPGTSRVSLESWNLLPDDKTLWLESGVEVTFIECINTLLKGCGYCTSISHRLSKYIEVLGAYEIDTPDELFINVDIREYDYGNEEVDEIQNLMYENDYSITDDDTEEPEDSDVFDFDDPKDEDGDGGSKVPPFLALKYIYKVELQTATESSISRHMEVEFGTPFSELDFEDINNFTEWDLKSTIGVKKVRGYQKEYTIWFYVLDYMDRIVDKAYIIGNLSTTTGHVVPLLFTTHSQVSTPGYTVIDIKTKLECLDPDIIEWDMPDEIDYGTIGSDEPEPEPEPEPTPEDDNEEILLGDEDDDSGSSEISDNPDDPIIDPDIPSDPEEEVIVEEDDFGMYGLDTFNFANGAYYYDFLYEAMPVVKPSKLYYKIGRKINGYYDDPATNGLERLTDFVVGPIESGQVITVVEYTSHTVKYGTAKAVVDDGSGEDIYFTLTSARANRKGYTVITIDNELEEGNSYVYKFIDDIRYVPEYLDVLSINGEDPWTQIGTSDLVEIPCNMEGRLLCICEVGPTLNVYRLGTVNVLVGIGDLDSMDAYISETISGSNMVKINVKDPNTYHYCTYYYSTKGIIPTVYHEMLSEEDWTRFELDNTPISIKPSNQIIVAECNDVGEIERFLPLITPEKYAIPTFNVTITSTNSYTNKIILNFNIESGKTISSYYYKIGGDARAYHLTLDSSWTQINKDYSMIIPPATYVTMVGVDNYKRVTSKVEFRTPDTYQDLDIVTIALISTSAESNNVVFRIVQATNSTQYYYNTEGIEAKAYGEYIDPNIWTRLPVGAFGTDDIQKCSLTIPPRTTLYVAQTDALYRATAKGTLITPSVYDSLQTISISITATLRSTNKVYIQFTRKANHTYYVRIGDIPIAYLQIINPAQWTKLNVDNGITANPSSKITLIEVNSSNEIMSYCKFTTPSSYADESGGGTTPDPDSDVPLPPNIPSVINYTLDETTIIKEIPNRTVGGYICGSATGFTFNNDKSEGYVVKSHTEPVATRNQKYAMNQGIITNIMSEEPELTRYDIKNTSGITEFVARNNNDVCYAVHNGEELLFYATMNDVDEDGFSLLVTNLQGVIQKKIMMTRSDGLGITCSGITYFKTDDNGDLLFIINRGAITNSDGSFKRKYGVVRYDGTTCVLEDSYPIYKTVTTFDAKYTARGIYYHPEQGLLYLIFYDSNRAESRYNYIFAFDVKHPNSDSSVYCTRRITIIGPEGGNFEIGSIDMDGNDIYAAIDRTDGHDIVAKLTIKTS